MRLRNKRTGEIVDNAYLFYGNGMRVHSLAEINKEWEDATVKDIKYYYCISTTGDVHELVYYGELTQATKDKMAIGNYFETREEAEKAVEKLKAWKRLKDAGVSFKIVCVDHQALIKPTADDELVTFDKSKQIMGDLELLFGGSDDN